MLNSGLGPETITIILLLVLLIALAIGTPVAFALGGTTVFVILFFLGPRFLPSVFLNVWKGLNNFCIVAVPLFIFMGVALEKSGIADDLFEWMHKMLGGLRGGLAIGTVLICAIFAACTGIVGAAVVTMGYVALPSMLKRHYHKDLALGAVTGGGTLGILIPPSIPMIWIGLFGMTSIGKLFAGGVLTGLLLASIMIVIILIRCQFNSNLGPPVPADERVGWREKLTTARALILPGLLILGVLGSIFSGIATPTEAAGVGAAGSLLCVVIKRRFTWSFFKEATMRAFRVTAFIMWIVFGAFVFRAVVGLSGARGLIESGILSLAAVNRWAPVIALLVLLLTLGTFMQIGSVIMITSPILFPLVRSLGFHPTWFGILMILTQMTGYISPPFGYNLFYMKSIIPDVDKTLKMGDIYRSTLPYILANIITMVIIMIFPKIVTWLPDLMF